MEDSEYYVRGSDDVYHKTPGKNLLKVLGDTEGELTDKRSAEVDLAVRAEHSAGMEALKGFFSEAFLLGLDKPFKTPETPDEIAFEKRRQEIFGKAEGAGRIAGNILPFLAGGLAGIGRGAAKTALKTAGKAPSALVFKGAEKAGKLAKEVAKKGGAGKTGQALAGAVGAGGAFSAIEAGLSGVKTGISTYKGPVSFKGDKKVKDNMSEAIQAGTKAAGETFATTAGFMALLAPVGPALKLTGKVAKESSKLMFGPETWGATGLRSAFFRISSSPSGRKGREILNKFIAKKTDSQETAINKLMKFVNEEKLGNIKTRPEMLEKIVERQGLVGEGIARERKRFRKYFKARAKTEVEKVLKDPTLANIKSYQKRYKLEVELKERLIKELEKTRQKGVLGKTILSDYNKKLDDILEILRGPPKSYKITARPPGPTKATYQAGTKLKDKTVKQFYIKSGKTEVVPTTRHLPPGRVPIGPAGTPVKKQVYTSRSNVRVAIGPDGKPVKPEPIPKIATTIEGTKQVVTRPKVAYTTRKTKEEIPDLRTRTVVTGPKTIKTEIIKDERGLTPEVLEDIMSVFSRFAKYTKREKGELAIDLQFRKGYAIASRFEDDLYTMFISAGKLRKKKLPDVFTLKNLKDRFSKLKDVEEIVKNAGASELRKIHGWDRILLGGAGGALGGGVAGLPGAVAGVAAAGLFTNAQNVGYKYLHMANVLERVNMLTRKARTPMGVKKLLNEGSKEDYKLSVPVISNMLFQRTSNNLKELSSHLERMDEWDKTTTGYEDLMSMVSEYGGNSNFTSTAVSLSRLKKIVIDSMPTQRRDANGKLTYDKMSEKAWLNDMKQWFSPITYTDSLKNRQMTETGYRKFGEIYPDFLSQFNVNFYQAVHEGAKGPEIHYYQNFLNSINSTITDVMYKMIQYPDQQAEAQQSKGPKRKITRPQPTVSDSVAGGVA